MKSKLKVFLVVLATFSVGSILLYTPLASALQSGQSETTELDGANVSELELIWWLLNKSEPVELEGEAVTLHRDMLIVSTAEDQVRIVLPEEWIVDANVVMREMLFGSGYLTVGENVTVTALRIDFIEKEDLSIYFLIGYKIVDESGFSAYAALPLNIEM